MRNFDYEKERYSVCLVDVFKGGSRTYFKYYRIADFNPDEDENELAPAIVQADVTTLEEARTNPDYLYSPSAVANYESRESDFYLFRWRLNQNDLDRQITSSFYDDASLLGFKEPREVIIPSGVSGELDLRNALSNGVPFSGKTTSVFYLAYKKKGNTWLALRCKRKDFLFIDGLIKLPVDFANTRGTVLSAPRVKLEGYDIIESPHPTSSYRMIYARLDELDSDRNVLLRPLSYYAADYVKWFIREESMQSSKSNRSAISQVITGALSRPDALEEYLGAAAPAEEIAALKMAICDIVENEDDSAKQIVREALLSDEGFRQECVAQVMAESNKLLEGKKHEIAEAEKAFDDAMALLDELEEKLCSRKAEREALEEELVQRREELDSLKSNQSVVLEEIQSNIALKLGLGAAAASPRNAAFSSAPIFVVDGEPIDGIEQASDFVSALSNNLKQAGVISIKGDSIEERANCAKGILGALAATRFLAIPADISQKIADALCACIDGRSAKRIVVPADCRDVKGVLANIHDDEAVVVVENVIDAINEGVLFALLSADVKPIIVFSFGSHASAQLMAKEAWGRVFLPAVEALVAFPRAIKRNRFQQVEGGLGISEVALDEAIDYAITLDAELDELHLQATTLLLAATVLRAIEDIVDDDEPGNPFISQHLLMASAADTLAYQAVDEWTEGDEGLTELALKLGIDEF